MKSENINPDEKTSSFPPPDRKAERKLSLKTAMALATKAPGHETLRPLMKQPSAESSSHNTPHQDTEGRLLDLQADIINREELLNQ